MINSAEPLDGQTALSVFYFRHSSKSSNLRLSSCNLRRHAEFGLPLRRRDRWRRERQIV
jgi:hypothetical protein